MSKQKENLIQNSPYLYIKRFVNIACANIMLTALPYYQSGDLPVFWHHLLYSEIVSIL